MGTLSSVQKAAQCSDHFPTWYPQTMLHQEQTSPHIKAAFIYSAAKILIYRHLGLHVLFSWYMGPELPTRALLLKRKRAPPKRVTEKTTSQHGDPRRKCSTTNAKHKMVSAHDSRHVNICYPVGRGWRGTKRNQTAGGGGSISREDWIFACFILCHKDAMSDALWV